MNSQTKLTIYNWIDKLHAIIISIITIGGFCWFIFYVRRVIEKVGKKEKEIFFTKDELDNLEKTLARKSAGYVNQGQLDKLVARNRKPLEAKLENLKMERQFLLDRVPIFGLIKK